MKYLYMILGIGLVIMPLYKMGVFNDWKILLEALVAAISLVGGVILIISNLKN